MKILHVGYSDTLGGASIAMMRLHSALKKFGFNSKVLVGEKLSLDENVIGANSRTEILLNELKIKLARQKKYIYKHDGKYSHSLNLFNSNILKKIDLIKPDVVNLHWVNNELISIKQIAKIKYPIVWTFNDMWPMCGGEHYSDNQRFIKGYNNTSKEINERGFDLNRFLWNMKRKNWSSNIKQIVCISNWLKKKAVASKLFKNHKIDYIPCTIDSSKWFPLDKIDAKHKLKLPINKVILLFMSTNGTKDFRKGFSYIKNYLENTKINKNNLLLLNVGENNNIKFNGIETKNINKKFNGEAEKLRLFYSASDILLTPSILEAFGQVAVEAASCGTPSIGFTNTGLVDAISHTNTGYLAKYKDQYDFNFGLNTILKNVLNDKYYYRNNCVKFVEDNFSSNLISKKYIELYKKTINDI
tara:strand:+ start:381 stop:1625 length:1245 start_codon:yes stop_codon:yes gene_type:complete